MLVIVVENIPQNSSYNDIEFSINNFNFLYFCSFKSIWEFVSKLLLLFKFFKFCSIQYIIYFCFIVHFNFFKCRKLALTLFKLNFLLRLNCIYNINKETLSGKNLNPLLNNIFI